MYREIIEHPWSLPPSLKKHLDLNAGNDRGRIYRVVPENFQQRKTPRLGQASTRELVRTLEHRNAWHRETAARLLYEQQNPAAGPALEKLFGDSKSALGRMHALCALDGLGALQVEHIGRGLEDTDERVREHAVRLAEKFVSVAPAFRLNTESSVASPALVSRLVGMTNDPSIQVRYQLAFALGDVRHARRIEALAAIARRDAGDSWVRAAVLSSLAEGTGEMFRLITAPAGSDVATSRNPDAASINSLQPFLRELVQVIGAKNQSNEVAAVLGSVG